MSNPTVNTEGTRPSSSSSNSTGSVLDSTTRETGVYRADILALSTSQNIKNVTSESRNEKMENTIVTSKKRQRVYKADRVKNRDKFNLQRLG